MRKPGREATIGAAVFLAPLALTALTYQAGLMPRFSHWSKGGVWPGLAILAFANLLLLALNISAMKRGDFLWYREPAITLAILLIVSGIILPTPPSARELHTPALGGSAVRSLPLTSASLASETNRAAA